MPLEPKKKVVQQIHVISQLKGKKGDEACGYHTLKNSLLTLLYMQGLLTEKKWRDLLNDIDFFNAFFVATKKVRADGSVDLSLPTFIDLLIKMKAGTYDFSQWGISQAQLKQLPILMNGSQNITVVNYHLNPGAPGHGLGGWENDLDVAAAAAKIARTKGPIYHVFALGLNNKHWVTVSMNRNAQGEVTWGYMDSWSNSDQYKNLAISKIEAVLNKSEAEIRTYLNNAYNNAIGEYGRLIDACFDYGAWSQVDKAAWRKAFILNKGALAECVAQIEHRYCFMKMAGWLSSERSDSEQMHLNMLYQCSNFLYEHAEATDIDVKAKLALIGQKLKPLMSHQHATMAVDEGLGQQVQATVKALKFGVPKPTEGFVARFVNLIYALLEGVKRVVTHVARSIGLTA